MCGVGANIVLQRCGLVRRLRVQSGAAHSDDTRNARSSHPSRLGALHFRDPGFNLTKLQPPHHQPQHHPSVPAPNCPLTATMGITDFFADVWETFAQPSPDAEAPVQGGSSTKSPASGTDEESGDEAEVNKQDAKKGGSSEQGHKPSDDDEEEEEEEEETVDPKEQLEKGEYDRFHQIWEIRRGLEKILYHQ